MTVGENSDFWMDLLLVKRKFIYRGSFTEESMIVREIVQRDGELNTIDRKS